MWAIVKYNEFAMAGDFACSDNALSRRAPSNNNNINAGTTTERRRAGAREGRASNKHRSDSRPDTLSEFQFPESTESGHLVKPHHPVDGLADDSSVWRDGVGRNRFIAPLGQAPWIAQLGEADGAIKRLRPTAEARRSNYFASGQPGVPSESIKNLSPQGLTFRDTGAIKIFRAIVGHPELRHQASGSSISDARMRHDLREANLSEAELKRCSRRLRGKSLSPERPCQPPTDFDRRREVGRKADVQQPGGAHEYAGFSRFQGPQAEAVRGLMVDLEIDPGIACVPRRERTEMLHDVGICRHFGEALPV
jgi:hypothetical protein